MMVGQRTIDCVQRLLENPPATEIKAGRITTIYLDSVEFDVTIDVKITRKG